MKIKTCVICGREFEAVYGQEKVCSDACKREKDAIWRKKYIDSLGYAECKQCHEVFKKLNAKQKFCSPHCAAVHAHKFSHKTKAERDQMAGAEAPKPVRRKDGKTLAQICAEAEAAHMTYGRYTALLYMKSQKGVAG